MESNAGSGSVSDWAKDGHRDVVARAGVPTCDPSRYECAVILKVTSQNQAESPRAGGSSKIWWLSANTVDQMLKEWIIESIVTN